tara:strand:- start:184 stop:759 length:576 start_codon:yes stop_codon:yes gene_type:complete
MNTFNYTSSLVILFSLIQNFIEINNSNYIFNIIYLSTIIIFLLLKKYKKNYNISINIIVYISLFISNIYLFFYKNNKEKILEGNEDPSGLCEDNITKGNMSHLLRANLCNKTDVQPTTGTADSCPTGVSPKNEVEADACSGIEVIGNNEEIFKGNEGINNFFNNVMVNCSKPITCDETNGTDKTNETGETV